MTNHLLLKFLRGHLICRAYANGGSGVPPGGQKFSGLVAGSEQ
jgi:hypothetical protein